MRQKVDFLGKYFASQREKHWFADETFWSLMRIRGVESKAPSGYAEAFHCRKMVIGMIFEPLAVPSAFLVHPVPHEDDRGFFARTWCAKEFAAHGLSPTLAQCSISFNKRRGTLRGLHFQAAPHGEAKLVRCTRGAIFDVVVDLRPESPTFLRHCGVTLSADDHRMMYVPEGCAHGFLTLDDERRGPLPDVVRSRRTRPRAACGGTTLRSTSHGPAPPDVIAERDTHAGRCYDRPAAEMHELGRRPVPPLPQHHRRRRAGDTAPGREAHPAGCARGSDRHAGLRLDRAARMEHPERTASRALTDARIVDFAVVEPPRHELQRARACPALPSRARRRTCTACPEQPDWVPYRTSYYSEDWGFCLSRATARRARRRRVRGRTSTPSSRDGHLTYGECLIPGETDDEVLISCHVCHPSLANDNLSGIAAATFLAEHLQSTVNRYSYRFLFIPGTIGSITWLAANQAQVHRIKHGLVLACIGDTAPVHLQAQPARRRTRGSRRHPRAQPLARRARRRRLLPVGLRRASVLLPRLRPARRRADARSRRDSFPEYHTSADDLDLVRPERPGRVSGAVCARSSRCWSATTYFENCNPMCEPRLGARGLYPSVGGQDAGLDQLALLWVLNLSDGRHSLLDIAERARLPFATIVEAADALRRVDLLRACS